MWKKIEHLCNDIYYLKKLFFEENLKNYIPRLNPENSLYILVNGPSLKDSLPKIIENNEKLQFDIMTVNFMTNEPYFEQLKPKYHVVSDMMFYDRSNLQDRVDDFFLNINKKTSWPLILFVQYKWWKDKQWLNKITNTNITIIPFHGTEAPLNEGFCIWVAKKRLLAADWGTVLHHCILNGMYIGYKDIKLYGADHTFFDGLCVNSKNQVCRRTSHFYNTESEVKPIMHHYFGSMQPYTMNFFLYEFHKIFAAHDILRAIADANGCKIFNCTPVSMLDSYERG